MDSAWEKIAVQSRKPIADFLASENLHFNSKTVLYPFSGTDVLNLFNFFPNSDYYICFGLEAAIAQSEPPSNYDLVKKNLKGIQILSKFLADRNYFTYKVMREEMNSGKLEGALPVYLAFLTRLGYQVFEVEPLELNRKLGSDSQKINGFRLRFYDPKTLKAKQLDYWKIFLVSGDTLGKDMDSDPLARYFEGLGKKAVFQKSAEYLFHGESRKFTRDLFLKNTNLVVQDDSGFPLRFFPEEGWKRTIYGSYDKSWNLPGAITPEPQPELLAYKMAKPLPFPFGYGVLAGKEKQRSLLMVVQKKGELTVHSNKNE